MSRRNQECTERSRNGSKDGYSKNYSGDRRPLDHSSSNRQRLDSSSAIRTVNSILTNSGNKHKATQDLDHHSKRRKSNESEGANGSIYVNGGVDGSKQVQFSEENKTVQYESDDGEIDITVLESFISGDNTGDEDADVQRLAEERRRKREEIMRKYENSTTMVDNSINISASIHLESRNVQISSSSELMAVTGTSVPLSNLNINDSKDSKDSNEAKNESNNNNFKENDLDAEGRQLEMERSAWEAAEKQNKGNGTNTGVGGPRFTFDMFSASPTDTTTSALPTLSAGMTGGRRVLKEALLEGETDHLQGNWDDREGYYKARIGELVGNRYRILGVVGKGVFSTVLKCVDVQSLAADSDNEENNGSNEQQGDAKRDAVLSRHYVAVKMIRNNDTMRKAAEKERAILLRIAQNDPNNKRFCVKLLNHLDYRSHVALVFEYQQMNLREALKKFGKDVGINIGAVRMYGRQLMVALKLLADLQVVHADIKLDNILCSGDLKQVKICDFGSAFFETDTDNDPTPYLVSRFYRAPEIILGLQYDRAIDMWSVCVCLYELFTGHVMFPGRTNNEMLRLIMAVKSRFPNRLIKSHLRAYEAMSLEPHFDSDMRFRQYELDAITNKQTLRLVDITGATRDLATVLRSSKAGADDAKLVTFLTDLLEKGLVLDPLKRLTVQDALRHPFFAASK